SQPGSIRFGSPTSSSGQARGQALCQAGGTVRLSGRRSRRPRVAARGVIGWALADHLEASLAIEALDMALTARNPEPGLIHHSDRGVQYACADYCDKLAARGVLISMSRVGNPYDNAKAERFMRTLKEEEVNGKTYASLDEARTHIGAFLENVYNRGRVHSALGYRPPVEFETQLRQTETV